MKKLGGNMHVKKLVLLIIIMFFFIGFMFARDYVVLIHSGVNIRFRPSTSSIVIGKASKGQLYHFFGEAENWYKITLFTGEVRFISKSLSAKLNETEIVPQHYFILPSSETEQKDIYRRVLRAKTRAKREAEEIIPASLDMEKHKTYYKILCDRYILEIFQNHQVHPALYDKLKNMGIFVIALDCW
jgi:hypothetical protein